MVGWLSKKEGSRTGREREREKESGVEVHSVAQIPNMSTSSNKPSTVTGRAQAHAAKSHAALTELITAYFHSTSSWHMFLDAYLLFVMLTGVAQFIYCVLVGTYPYNAFLAGFISSVGSFIFGGMFPVAGDEVLL